MKEKSVFVEYFGDYPLIRVLDFLIEARDMDYSMTEIAKNAGVGWTAFSEMSEMPKAFLSMLKKHQVFFDIWPQLTEKQIVVLTRKVGNAKLFRLNTGNQWVKELIRMDKVITKLETDKMLNKQKRITA